MSVWTLIINNASVCIKLTKQTKYYKNDTLQYTWNTAIVKQISTVHVHWQHIRK